MLLLITGSSDGTSDLLVSELGNKNVFRFNYDLFKDYHLEFTPNYWKISNPVGHSIDSNLVTSAFWWKAFNYFLMNQEEFIVEEVKYIFREIYHWCRIRNLTKGNSHDFHNHMGKINILNIASKYFVTPKTLITLKMSGIEKFDENEIVAKSLTSGLTTTNKALFTTAVKKETLHPDFPWFLQEKISSNADLTVFICGQNFYCYEKDRTNLTGLDWRSEQSFDVNKKEWFRFNPTEELINSLKNFCLELNVDWGRVDLMRNHEGKNIFLEFNANGQWVFLDYMGDDALVKVVANYLLPKYKN
jgi:hypothetical protein